ncbi:hypothetical protein ACFT9I_17855 [Streptomyces sp. NPDC057137]|uniref:hypothetical protein n=1 Tax=Streptomyces sp. NPDC057137 TaxID=3346030 RepID=UPI003636AA97
MAHERETWLDRGVAELLLRGRPVETADVHAQAQADRLARVLEEAADDAYDVYAGSAELPGEAAALAAFRQSVGTTAGTTVGTPGRTASRSWDADARAGGDGIGTVRLDPERGGVRLPSFGRPLRLGLAAAVAGCALSGVAAGAGFLYAPSAGESPPRPANSLSDALTPEPLVSESPSSSLDPPPLPADTEGGADSVAPGASGADTGAGGPKNTKKSQATGNGWRSGDGEKWYVKLVQACNEYRSGKIAPSKKELLEDAAKGPQGVTRLCNQLLSGDPDGDGHHDGAQGNGGNGNGGGDGGSTGGGGGDGPQSGGPIEGGPAEGGTPGDTGGGTDGGSSGGTDGGTGGGSEGPPSDWPGGDYGETIGMNPPESDEPALPPQLPATPGSDTGSGSSSGPAPDDSAPDDSGTDEPAAPPAPDPEPSAS